MSRQVEEIHTFSRQQIEESLKSLAKLKIIGSIYYGEFDAQRVEWMDDGSARVFTIHSPDDNR